jgi:S-adenosylmethionine synthetase
VTEGHPDKVADQISDSILDAIMAQDKHCRVACETLVTTGMAFIAGEITTSTYVEIPQIVRDTIKDIGYSSSKMGFDWQTCAVMTSIDHQSLDISMGVDKGNGLYKEQGAGDQGLMFGYATTDPSSCPCPSLAWLCRRLSNAQNGSGFSAADGKTRSRSSTRRRAQASMPVSRPAQTARNMRRCGCHHQLRRQKVIPAHMMDGETRFYINATGRFVIGGPMGDCGLTGRKIIVDTYGGQGSHGGGCFSGKDPSKVDRSASYMARHVAKNIVAAGLAKRCEVQIAYAIGVAEPVSILVDTMGTGKLPNGRIRDIVREADMPRRPSSVSTAAPIYRKTRPTGTRPAEPEFTWKRGRAKPCGEGRISIKIPDTGCGYRSEFL